MKRIVAVSLRFGVLCRFTAFVAVDRAHVIDQRAELHRMTQPVESPAGWDSICEVDCMLASPAAIPAAPPPTASKSKSRRSWWSKPEVGRYLGKGIVEFKKGMKGLEDDMVTMGKLPQTPQFKQVLEDAIEEARAMNHEHVDAEHLLLGLLHQTEGPAAETLRNLGLELAEVREKVRAEFARQGKATGLAWPKNDGYNRFTQRARKVLQLANQEAQSLNHSYLGAQHLLLAVLREESGLVAYLLKEDGAISAAAGQT